MAVESPVRSWWYEQLYNALLKKSGIFRTPSTFVNITPLNYSGREERVLKKGMFGIEGRNFIDTISCFIYCPSGGDFVKQNARGIDFYLSERNSKVF